MTRLEKIVARLSRRINLVGYVTIVMLMALTVGDVTGRYFGHPISGTVEITGWLGLITVTSAIAYTYIMKGHISIYFVVSKLPQRAQAIIGAITSLLGSVFFCRVVLARYCVCH